MSAMAAYRAGAGLVRILTVEENIPVLKALAPEAVLSVCRVENGRLGEETKKELPKLMEWADVFAAGPGLSQEPYAGELLSLLLKEARAGESLRCWTPTPSISWRRNGSFWAF